MRHGGRGASSESEDETAAQAAAAAKKRQAPDREQAARRTRGARLQAERQPADFILGLVAKRRTWNMQLEATTERRPAAEAWRWAPASDLDDAAVPMPTTWTQEESQPRCYTCAVVRRTGT